MFYSFAFGVSSLRVDVVVVMVEFLMEVNYFITCSVEVWGRSISGWVLGGWGSCWVSESLVILYKELSLTSRFVFFV